MSICKKIMIRKCKKMRVSKKKKIIIAILPFLLLGSILFFNNYKSDRIVTMDFPDNVSLSEEELLLLSSDAEEYHKSLAEANSGSLGIDLPLILKIYKENLIAEKVYNKIISDVKKTDEMFNDEYEEACIKYFEKIYKKLCKEQAKDWMYSTHVNVSKLGKIELARTFDDEDSSSENESEAGILLDSLVGMEGTK